MGHEAAAVPATAAATAPTAPAQPQPMQYQNQAHCQYAQPQYVQTQNPQPQYPQQQLLGQQVGYTVPQTKEWTAGLFDCFQDIGLCCDVFWCTPCVQGRLYDALFEGRPNSMNEAVCCVMLVAPWFVGGAANFFFTWLSMDKTRKKYGIMGDPCSDCCASFCCFACATCQMHRELSAHGASPGHVCCPSDIQYNTLPPSGVAQPAYPVVSCQQQAPTPVQYN